jgi:hypothetical protein
MNADRLKELRAFVEHGMFVPIGDIQLDLLALIDSAIQPASTGEIGEIVDGLRQVPKPAQHEPVPVAHVVAAIRRLKTWPGYLNAEERELTFDRAIAALSHPGEQQQLRERVAGIAENARRFYLEEGRLGYKMIADEADSIATALSSSAELREAAKCATCHRVQCTCTGLIPIEGWCDLCGYPENNGQTHKQDSEHGLICNVPANQSAAPTAGDAALREAAKAGAEAINLRIGRAIDAGYPAQHYTDWRAHAQLLERFAGATP